jgi:hypothetical protein
MLDTSTQGVLLGGTEEAPAPPGSLDELRAGGYESPYRLRKQTVEPVFGQIQEARGLRAFLLRTGSSPEEGGRASGHHSDGVPGPVRAHGVHPTPGGPERRWTRPAGGRESPGTWPTECAGQGSMPPCGRG